MWTQADSRRVFSRCNRRIEEGKRGSFAGEDSFEVLHNRPVAILAPPDIGILRRESLAGFGEHRIRMFLEWTRGAVTCRNHMNDRAIGGWNDRPSPPSGMAVSASSSPRDISMEPMKGPISQQTQVKLNAAGISQASWRAVEMASVCKHVKDPFVCFICH